MITFLQAGQWYAIQVGFDQLWELNTISSFFASAGISQVLSALVVKKISRWLWTAPHIISSLQYGHLIILPPFVNLLLVYYSFQNSWSCSTSTLTISDQCIVVCKWWFSCDSWEKISIFHCVRVVFGDFVIMVLSLNIFTKQSMFQM